MSQEPVFVKVLETGSQTDVALIKSVLDGEGIRYYLQGEYSMILRGIEPVCLMVVDADLPRAVEALKGLDLNYLNAWFPGNG